MALMVLTWLFKSSGARSHSSSPTSHRRHKALKLSLVVIAELTEGEM